MPNIHITVDIISGKNANLCGLRLVVTRNLRQRSFKSAKNFFTKGSLASSTATSSTAASVASSTEVSFTISSVIVISSLHYRHAGQLSAVFIVGRHLKEMNLRRVETYIYFVAVFITVPLGEFTYNVVFARKRSVNQSVHT